MDQTGEPSTLAEWGEFHRAVDALSDEAKEVFGLIWYDGFTQQETADLLEVSLKTVQRRWQDARIALAEVLGHEPSGR